MKVLNNKSEVQTIRIIPRSYPDSLTLSLRDDQTNDVVNYSLEGLQFNTSAELWNLLDRDWQADSVGFILDKDYLVIDNVYSLREYHFYDLTVTDQDGDVIYKDKIFCTNQPIVDFSVNGSLTEWQLVENNFNEYAELWDDNIYVEEPSYDNDYIII
jgi:hypothetical protein